MKQTAERAGARAIEVGIDWRRAFLPSQVAEVLDRERDVKLVMMLHNETLTGPRNPIGEVGESFRESGSLFLVDTVPSWGGDENRRLEYRPQLYWLLQVHQQPPQVCR